MKRNLGLIFLWLGVLVGFGVLAQAATQVCNRSDFYCFESGPSQNLSAQGRLDSAGDLYTFGSEVYVPINVTIPGSTTILNVTSTFERLLSTGGAQSLVGISTTGIQDGAFLVLAATADVNVITISSGTSAATGVHLQATTRTVGVRSKLGLLFDAFDSLWNEVWYAAN